MSKRIKIAIVVSHPIQHFCPQYVSFAQNDQVILRVFFASAMGYKKYMDPNFKQEVAWDNLQLDKFDHEFLNGEKVLQPDKNIDAGNLDNALQLFNPELLIVYGYFQRLQRHAYKWATKNKVPLAYISDSERRQQRGYAKELLKYFFIKRYFSGISYFLSVGDANEAYYGHYGVPQAKILRMHFPVDISQYRPAYNERNALRTAVRQQYGISENEIVLTVVGKLVPWKNQDHIIQAMKLLEAENIYLHLFVLGSGEMQTAWQNEALSLTQSKVYFPGFVPAGKLPAFYAATDIYVHPASVEPHSIAVSEAIYMGCPIIISDRCGSYGENDDVQEGKNGYIYPFGNITQLAACIKMLVKDRGRLETFSTFSHKTGQQFQESAHITILQKLINQLKGIEQTHESYSL